MPTLSCLQQEATGMKYTLSGYVEPTARKLAQQQGLELVDVELVKENTGRFLRFYIDSPEGVDLDRLENFHRSVLPLMENVEYDYMEVSSPGADRPLKRPQDFDRAAGTRVEIRLYRALNGAKYFTGTLVGLEDGNVILDADGGERLSFPKKDCALVAPLIELDEEAIDAALEGVFDEDEAEDEAEDNMQPEDDEP